MLVKFKFTNGWIRYYNYYISVGCKDINESSKVRVFDFYVLERSS